MAPTLGASLLNSVIIYPLNQAQIIITKINSKFESIKLRSSVKYAPVNVIPLCIHTVDTWIIGYKSRKLTLPPWPNYRPKVYTDGQYGTMNVQTAVGSRAQLMAFTIKLIVPIIIHAGPVLCKRTLSTPSLPVHGNFELNRAHWSVRKSAIPMGSQRKVDPPPPKLLVN